MSRERVHLCGRAKKHYLCADTNNISTAINHFPLSMLQVELIDSRLPSALNKLFDNTEIQLKYDLCFTSRRMIHI